MCYLHLDNLSRNDGKDGYSAGRGAAMLMESLRGPNSMIGRNCGKTDTTRAFAPCLARTMINGTTVAWERRGNLEKRHLDITSTSFSLCTRPPLVSPPIAPNRERLSRRRTTCFAFVLGAHSLPSKNFEKPPIAFDDDFDSGVQV